jgi:hypothetical protein
MLGVLMPRPPATLTAESGQKLGHRPTRHIEFLGHVFV